MSSAPGIVRRTRPVEEEVSIRLGRFTLVLYGRDGGEWTGQVMDRERAHQTMAVGRAATEDEARAAALAALADLRDALLEISARDDAEAERVGLLRPVPAAPESGDWELLVSLPHPDCVCDRDLCEGRTVTCHACERTVPECAAVADRYCAPCSEVPC